MKARIDLNGALLRGVLSAFLVVTGIAWSNLCAAPTLADGLSWLPPPKTLQLTGGTMALGAKSGIIATDPRLEPLAGILAGEIEMLTGLKLATVKRAPQAGDIILRINPQLRAGAEILAVQAQGAKPAVVRTRDFAHRIGVTDMAVVEGWDYRAVCEGTATLLQALGGKPGAHFLPRMTLKDWPYADYTGTSVDVARQRIPIDALKAVVEACRLTKVRYCLLHLTDDEGFTFPSAAFPKLGTTNTSMHGGVVPGVYPLQELRDLVSYADARGVTLVPELATPNHCQAMCRAMPQWAGPKILNLINDDIYKDLDTLVGEMCDVFKSSPYFHMGGEEPYFFEIEELNETKAYMQKKGMNAFTEVVLQHQDRMIASIRKRGKMPLAWEGGTVENARQKDDMIIMSWLPYPLAEETQKKGFTTITVPWERGPGLQKWNIFNCNGVNLTPANKVLGGSVTMWQMSATALVSDFLGGKLNDATGEGYIRSTGDHMPGAWSPLTPPGAEDYARMCAATRAKLEALLFPVRITGAPAGLRLWPLIGGQAVTGTVTVTLALAAGVAAGEIRYTTDGSEPTARSTVAVAPLSLDETATVHAALFRNGQQVGAVSRATYVQSVRRGP